MPGEKPHLVDSNAVEIDLPAAQEDLKRVEVYNHDSESASDNSELEQTEMKVREITQAKARLAKLWRLKEQGQISAGDFTKETAGQADKIKEKLQNEFLPLLEREDKNIPKIEQTLNQIKEVLEKLKQENPNEVYKEIINEQIAALAAGDLNKFAESFEQERNIATGLMKYEPRSFKEKIKDLFNRLKHQITGIGFIAAVGAYQFLPEKFVEKREEQKKEKVGETINEEKQGGIDDEDINIESIIPPSQAA